LLGRYRQATIAKKAPESVEFDEAFAKIQDAVDLSMNLKYQEPWVGDVTSLCICAGCLGYLL
jgi:hypothetical protein